MGDAETEPERVGRNNATFRNANEQIGRSADEYGVGSLIPFLCECADPVCTSVIQLSADEYRAVRQHPRHFIQLPGHEAAAAEAERVVERHDGYVVVEKIGRAGEIAEAEDPRSRP